MSRIGIFGGTFNPVHNGHINLLNKVCESISLDKIYVFPTFIPPHKIAVDLASGEDRLAMCRLAFEDNLIVQISDFELKQEGKSYTINTLIHLKSIYPDDELFLIMGSDMLLTIEEWKSYKEIFKLCTIVGATRNTEDSKRIISYSNVIKNMGGKVIIIPVNPYVISSTDIRSMIAQGLDYTCYLPQKVVKYIRYRKLYQ